MYLRRQLAESCVSRQKVEHASRNICGSMRGRYCLPLTLYRCLIIFTRFQIEEGIGGRQHNIIKLHVEQF